MFKTELTKVLVTPTVTPFITPTQTPDCITIEFEYDIPGYVQNETDLKSATYEFDFPEDKNMSLQRFCEQIFFARRRNFGKAWITKL